MLVVLDPFSIDAKVCPRTGREVVACEQALLGKDITTIKRGTGCTHCNGTGYRGRIAVHEIVTIDRNIRRMISRGAEIEEIEAYAQEQPRARSPEGKGSGTGKTGVTTPEEELLRIAYAHNRETALRIQSGFNDYKQNYRTKSA